MDHDFYDTFLFYDSFVIGQLYLAALYATSNYRKLFLLRLFWLNNTKSNTIVVLYNTVIRNSIRICVSFICPA